MSFDLLKTEFTFEEAFDIQLEHLQEWSKVLNAKAYTMLLERVIEENRKDFNSPYDVPRGSDLDNYINEIIQTI